MRGKNNILKIVFILVGCSSFLLFQEVAMSQTIVDELRQVRKENNAATIQIDGIVLNHIPIGTRLEDATALLKKEGFVIHEVEPRYIRNKADRTLIASYQEKESFPLSFKDEVRIVFDVKDGVIVHLTGKIIYKSL